MPYNGMVRMSKGEIEMEKGFFAPKEIIENTKLAANELNDKLKSLGL